MTPGAILTTGLRCSALGRKKSGIGKSALVSDEGTATPYAEIGSSCSECRKLQALSAVGTAIGRPYLNSALLETKPLKSVEVIRASTALAGNAKSTLGGSFLTLSSCATMSRMINKEVTASILALTLASAHGNLFDTEEQWRSDMGELVTTEEISRDSWRRQYSKHEYRWSNYNIQAWLFYGMKEGSGFEMLNGKVVFQKVNRTDKMSMDSHEIESFLRMDGFKYQMARFLKVDGVKYKWVFNGGDSWKLGKNGTAQYDRMDRTLILRFGEHGPHE
jgi:hypothetical protein